MENETNLEAPSKAAIAKATGIALVIALLLLFVAVLPAEYGVDPLKTGKALGLMGLAASGADNSSGRASAVAVSAGVYTSQPKIYKVDSEDFQLGPNEGVEMKYHMQKGASMVYGWKADGKLAFEFHGEPDQKPTKDYYESYELDDKIGKEESYGSFIAPSTGIHGWFWQNKGHKEVKFHLTTAGFYDSAKMMSNGASDNMPVEDAK
jgi:hypothetical protein